MQPYYKMVGGLEVWHSACNRGTRVRFPVDDQPFRAQILFAYRENLECHLSKANEKRIIVIVVGHFGAHVHP